MGEMGLWEVVGVLEMRGTTGEGATGVEEKRFCSETPLLGEASAVFCPDGDATHLHVYRSRRTSQSPCAILTPHMLHIGDGLHHIMMGQGCGRIRR